ncbi:HAD hydrolase, family IA, variant 3 [Ancylostoma ceylanicum]|uniref:HAD hydrolase, family IA, variant 3 n=1 Tax=Ancylostoma ceylanicum TaxID=53326 RepID=A0A0D6LV81_9BILA|nr:HAD hydrolase, family IA, variant 3 [Ancylostoma ceylanicum]
MEVPKPAVTHIIFDFDGLLVDTEPCYTIANQAILGRYGREFTVEMKGMMMGRKPLEAIIWLLEEVGLADQITPEEYATHYDVMLGEMFKKCRALPGAERLVRHFANKVLSGDDESIKRGKPHPDGFLETMKRFPERPSSASSVLVFEDAPNGVKAAFAAGMQCVMVPDEMFHEEAKTLSADRILSSLEEFRPEEFEMTMKTMKVTHVIFDVDGTLLDTESCYEMANQAMLSKFGRKFTPEMKANMMGRNGAEATAWLVKEVGISDQITAEEFAAQKDAMLAEMFPKCNAFPGAERLVRHFARKHSPNGAQAAIAAGVLCVMVPDPALRQQSQSLKVAKVLSSLEEFKPEEFGLPPFD